MNGENESPLYTYLKAQAPADDVQGFKNKLAMKAISKLSDTAKNASDIQWNFTKFLVDKEGNVVKRYSPTCTPKEIEKDIEKVL